MSVILQIYGNHNLKIDSYESGISEIEKALRIKIQRSSADVKLSEETDDFNKIHFLEWPHFYDGKIDQQSIWLRMNYDQCQSLRVFKYGFDLFLISKINRRYNIWKTLVSKGFLDDPEMKEYLQEWNSQYSDWNNLRTFARHVLHNFQGNKLVYINDYNFQNFGPDLEFGMKFEKALDGNRKISDPIDYKLLVDHGNQNDDLKDWYVEQFNFKY